MGREGKKRTSTRRTAQVRGLRAERRIGRAPLLGKRIESEMGREM